MPSRLPNHQCLARDAADYGFARARDIAFDAVHGLWRRRSAEGMKQVDIARAIGRDAAWVCRSLRGPGNWTLRTIGELVYGMNGELEIAVHGIEDPLPERPNFHAYAGYEPAAVQVRVTQPSPAPNTLSTTNSVDQAQLYNRFVMSVALTDVP
jgi:hypothetical protein